MAIIAQQAATIAQLVADAAELRALLAAEKAKTEARREKAAEKKRRQRADVPADVSGQSRDMSPVSLTPPVPPISPAPRTPHPHPPHNPPLNPAHVPAHVGTPEPLPFEDGPVREPGEGDDILEAKSEALVKVPAGRGLQAAPKPKDVYPFEFEAFWKPYPRKVVKDAALESWKRALARGATAEEIRAGLDRWLGSVDWKEAEMKHLPHATTWLNQRRWRDEPEQATRTAVIPVAADGRPDDLAGYRKLVAWCHSDRERIEVLVDRARGVNKVVLDVAEALEILEGRGLDAAIRWVATAIQVGVKARQGVSRG